MLPMKITCRCNPTGTLPGWNYKLRSWEELFVTLAEVVPLQNHTISIPSLEPEQTKHLFNMPPTLLPFGLNLFRTTCGDRITLVP